MRVVIMGCGRTGSLLAARLSEARHEVAVIDWNDASFSRLPDNFAGDSVLGNGLDQDVLKEAGITHADVFVAATSGDNRNVMASQIAKEVFRVPKVISRIRDPIRAEIYRQCGIQVDCRTTEGARLILDLVEE